MEFICEPQQLAEQVASHFTTQCVGHTDADELQAHHQTTETTAQQTDSRNNRTSNFSCGPAATFNRLKTCEPVSTIPVGAKVTSYGKMTSFSKGPDGKVKSEVFERSFAAVGNHQHQKAHHVRQEDESQVHEEKAEVRHLGNVSKGSFSDDGVQKHTVQQRGPFEEAEKEAIDFEKNWENRKDDLPSVDDHAWIKNVLTPALLPEEAEEPGDKPDSKESQQKLTALLPEEAEEPEDKPDSKESQQKLTEADVEPEQKE